MSSINVCAILPAAGSGTRIGGDIKKQYLHLDGKPILVHTIMNLCKFYNLSSLLLVVPKLDIPYCEKEIVEKYKLTSVSRIVAGGKRRQDSVYNAVKYIPDNTEVVIVHDGVRPFITEKLVKDTINTAFKSGASIAAVPEKNTIKEVNGDHIVTGTLDRSKVWEVQTPQAFKKNIFLKAFSDKNIKLLATDEASLVERIGIPVKVTYGSYLNIKITVKEDLGLAEYINDQRNKLIK